MFNDRKFVIPIIKRYNKVDVIKNSQKRSGNIDRQGGQLPPKQAFQEYKPDVATPFLT